MKAKKLSVKDKLGYTIGSIGDSTSYNFVLSFFSFFMTTVAGVSPAIAGLIISLAIAWDAITDPIIGYMVDHSKSKKGKRRPYILRSLIPMGASIILMFLNVDFPQVQKNIYFLVLVLIFWTSYTAFNIPFYSFGAVLSDDDTERVSLSAYREVLGYVGIFCASSVPTFLVGLLLKQGWNNSEAWFAAAVVVAVITVSSIAIMWRATQGKEPVEENEEVSSMNIKGFFADVWSLLKMKPYLLVIVCALFTNIYMTLFNSNLMYYVVYNMGAGETQASAMFTAMNIVSILFIPFITKGVAVFSKQRVFITSVLFSGLVMIAMKFIGVPNVYVGCIYVILVGVGTCAYWMCIFNFLYDVIDYDEFKTGKKRDGIIMSYYSFLLKLGGAVASALQGFCLQLSGFDAELTVQGAGALNTIALFFTVVPGICLIIAGLAIVATPLKDERMVKLRAELDKKRSGLEYNELV